MLQILTILILISLCFLSTQIFKKPGFALAICWSMLTLESTLQQGNAFLLQHSSFINIAIAGLAGLSATWAVLNGRLRSVKIPTNLLFYVGLMAFAGCSLLWSQSPDSAHGDIRKTLPYIAVFCFIAPLCAFDEKQLKHAINVTMCFGGLLLVAIIISERQRRGIYLTTIGGKVIESNPLANASYAAIVTICALFSIYRHKSGALVFGLKAFVAALGLYAIVKSGSRGQLLAVMATCLIWFPITAKLAAKRSTIISIAVGFVVIVGTILMIDESQWSGRWNWEQFNRAGNGRFASVNIMLEHYWEAGGTTLLFGLGNSSSYTILSVYPHNVPVEVLCEEGLVGFAILSSIIGLTFLKGIGVMRSDSLSTDMRVQLGILMAIATFLVIISLKQGSFWGSSLMFSVFITLGWTFSWLKKNKGSSSRSRLARMQLPVHMHNVPGRPG